MLNVELLNKIIPGIRDLMGKRPEPVHHSIPPDPTTQFLIDADIPLEGEGVKVFQTKKGPLSVDYPHRTIYRST